MPDIYDSERLSAALYNFDAAALQGRWDLVGGETQQFLGRSHIALGRQTEAMDVRFCSGFRSDELAHITSRFAAHARAHAEAIARQPDGVTDRALTDRLLEAVGDPLHSYLRETHGLRHALSASLGGDGRGRCMIGVMSSADQPLPGAEESVAFRALVAGLRRAVSVLQLVERNAALTRGLQAAFDEVAVGLILCTDDARPLHINAAAADLIAAQNALSLERDVLRLWDPAAQATLRAEIARAASGKTGRGDPVQARRADPALPVIVTVTGFGPGLAAIFLEDPDRALLPARDRLEQAAGLSRAQATVALLAAQGELTTEIAARMGVRVNTVRTHLRRAFAKLDCSDRRELALRLAGLGCLLR